MQHLREMSPLYEMVKEGIDLTQDRVGRALELNWNYGASDCMVGGFAVSVE